MAPSHRRAFCGCRRAFSLVELLIVILIVAVVIAIVVPALGGARTAAKKVASQQVMSDLNQASQQFSQDKRRLPGYFSQKDMGASENAIPTGGWTNVENMLLELAGGVDPTNGTIQVGPRAASRVMVNPGLIGTSTGSSKAYYTPSQKYLVPQDGVAATSGMQEGLPDNRVFPDLVDAFGNPVLAWVQDESGPSSVRNEDDFAREASDTGASQFYWNSNAGFLKSIRLGRSGRNQTSGAPGADGSLFDQGREESLRGFLGNPSYPALPLNATTWPTAGRGSVVFQSAGPDGVYLGKTDRGGRSAGTNPLRYSVSFMDSGGNLYSDSEGRNITQDLLKDFDDIVVTGGN